MAISTAYDCVTDVVGALVTNGAGFISLPTDNATIKSNAARFYTYGYPNVYGAIGGRSIAITVPRENSNDQFTQTHPTSINLIAVCDATEKFLAVTIGVSAESNNCNIFKSSQLGKAILTENAIPKQYHIIGDATYDLHLNVMVPYPGVQLTAEQDLHNTRHSSTLMAIERAFGDLRSRWMCLESLNCDLILGSRIITACAILHNICIVNGDTASTARQEPVSINVRLNVSSPGSKRDAVANHLSGS